MSERPNEEEELMSFLQSREADFKEEPLSISEMYSDIAFEAPFENIVMQETNHRRGKKKTSLVEFVPVNNKKIKTGEIVPVQEGDIITLSEEYGKGKRVSNKNAKTITKTTLGEPEAGIKFKRVRSAKSHELNAPLAVNKIVDIEELEKDIKRLEVVEAHIDKVKGRRAIKGSDFAVARAKAKAGPKKSKGLRDFSRCPRCGAETIPSITITKVPSTFWRECTRCNTYINTYIPQKHQQDFHRDGHRYKGNFGGYGSGKTTTTREEFYKHMFLTPNGTGLIGANIMPQYEQTIKRDIESDFPVALVKDISVQKSYVEFINGYRLMYRPFDDAGKLRSLNLDFLAIVEGSEVDPQIFTIGKTRLRNIAATLPQKVNGEVQYEISEQGVPIPIIAHDWRQTIVESNPDAGWIKSDVLLVSDYIQYNGPTVDTYSVDPEVADKAISSHVTDTSQNAFLPPTYMRDVAKNRPKWWVDRYLHGSFTYAEGLVYPSALKNHSNGTEHIIQDYDIPKHWKRVFAFDYGLYDHSGGVWAAIDEDNSKLVIYKEFYVTNRNVEDLANLIKDGSRDVPQGGFARPYIIDPKSGVKRDYNKISLIDHFLEYGIAFQTGQVSVDARVFKLNTYFEQDRIEIFASCKNLIHELSEYKFPSDESGNGRKDKPEDKNNHLINPLEWIVMELPANPADILYGIYSGIGEDVTKQRKIDEQEYLKHIFDSAKQEVYNPLSDDNVEEIDFYGGLSFNTFE